MKKPSQNFDTPQATGFDRVVEEEDLSTHNTREIEAWKKLAREKLAPKVTYIDPKFKEVASWAEELLNAFWVEQQKDLDAFIDTLHQELQKAREEEREETREILRCISRMVEINATNLENYILGQMPIVQSELDQPNK